MASLIQRELPNKDLREIFLQGMRGNHQAKIIGFQPYIELATMEKELEKGKNLQRANEILSSWAKEKNSLELIPGKIYYQLLKEGSGPHLSEKGERISFHYSFQFFEDSTKGKGTALEQSRNQCITGIGMALLGMRKGEIREVIIHPAYGYGEKSFFPKNMPLIAIIELLDFIEGQNISEINPPYTLVERNIEALSLKSFSLQKELVFHHGTLWRDFLREENVIFPLDIFEKALFSEAISIGTKESNDICLML